MFNVLLLLFIAVPVLEIYLFIQVGEQIGLFPTLLTIVLTAILGASLVRREGIKTLLALQERLNNNEVPGRELADGAMLLLAGVLLVTPGFFTDAVGFALAFPLTRILLRNRLVSLLMDQVRVSGSGFQFYGTTDGFGNPRQPGTGQAEGGSTIEGEFQRDAEEGPTEPNPKAESPTTPPSKRLE